MRFLQWLLLVSLMVAVPFLSASKPVSTEDQVFPNLEGLRIATYNIHRGFTAKGVYNIQEIIHTLRSTHADVIALQEVERFNPLDGFDDQAQMIATSLNMNYVFIPTVSYLTYEFGIAILSTYPITYHHVVALTSVLEPRAALFATIQAGDQSVSIINTHMGLSFTERIQHLEKIRAWMKTNLQADKYVLLGDFNSRLTEKEYSIPFAGLHNSTQKPIETFKGLGQIDHVFLSPTLMSQDTFTLPSQASDHFPLVTDIRW